MEMNLEGQPDRPGRTAAQDGVHSTAGSQGVHPEARKHEAEAAGYPCAGGQAGAGGARPDIGGDL